jgi:endonuclease/exonuclease/phosphatase family metal-dependent hydrolase
VGKEELMAQIKIATFNCEWMVSIFGALWKNWVFPTIPDSFPGKNLGEIALDPIEDIPGLCERIAAVIRGINAEIIGIQEGPPRIDQMQAFVDRFLGGDYTVFHSNENWQSISALVHKSIASQVTAWQPELPPIKKRWSAMPYYPWGLIAAAEREAHRFQRHPLLLSFKPQAGKELQLMVLHTKSKYSKLKEVQQWEMREREAILDALNARAKLSAEIYRVREFLNQQFEQLAPGAKPLSIVLMGDLNDGPYAELIEREFLMHNVVDELVGTLLKPEFYFRHAMSPEVLGSAATTHFPDPLEGGQIVEELIDHILVSPAIWKGRGDFRLKANSCRVEMSAYEKQFADTGPIRKRHLRPSDHRPVSVILRY